MKATKNNLMYGEHIGESEAALYVDCILKDDLSSLKDDVLEHVAACPECKDKILDLYLFLRNPDAAAAAGAQGEIIKFPAAPGRRFFSRKAAAVFVLFALILTAYFLVFKKEPFSGKQAPGITGNRLQQRTAETGPAQSQDAASPDAVRNDERVPEASGIDASRQGAPGRLTPPEYRVNPNLENMIGNRLRSAAVQVHSPQDNIYLKRDILFSWEDSQTKPLHLKILNNKNEVLFEYSTTENRFVFEEKLGAGLYYWKLESNNDLLYVGKFLIK